jgi:adenosylcobinamide-phosphate synthase
MAGALGLRLAGPRVYDGAVVDDHWIGDGRQSATAKDIRMALKQYWVACAMQFAGVAALAAAMALA